MASTLRVLHVISSLDPLAGGPTASLIGMAIAQAQSGLEVSILSTFAAKAPVEVIEELRRAGIKGEMIGPTTGRLMKHPELARRTDSAVAQADIVHIHAMWEEVQHQAARASQRRGVPYLIQPHGMLTRWSLAQSKWVKRVMLAFRVSRNLRRAAAIHYTTAMEHSQSLSFPGRTLIEPNGIDTGEFANLPARGTFRSQYPQTQGKPLIVFLGRIHPGKGLRHLVPALARCRCKKAMLAIVGPNSENKKKVIEGLIVLHGLQDRVIFTGMICGAEKVAALTDADLFCLPSDHENFGMAIVEALASGTPVIVSKHVAIWKEIVDAGVGAAVDQDAQTLGGEISRWLEDDQLRDSARSKARAFVWEHYDWSTIGGRWKSNYQALLNAGVCGGGRAIEVGMPR